MVARTTGTASSAPLDSAVTRDRSTPPLTGAIADVASQPVYRTILALDVERSTNRSNQAKAQLRRATYSIIEAAMQVAGIGAWHCDPFVDRGDGVLILVRPVDEVPKTLLFQPLIPVLSCLLAEYNASLPCAERLGCELRLRAVIHCGEVHCDRNGPFGQALDIACRLLDSRSLKECLAQADAPLVLIVSDEIYKSIVLQEYAGICPRTFVRSITVRVSGRRQRGWIHLPDVRTWDDSESLAAAV
jgi:hypothetical protein